MLVGTHKIGRPLRHHTIAPPRIPVGGTTWQRDDVEFSALRAPLLGRRLQWGRNRLIEEQQQSKSRARRIQQVVIFRHTQAKHDGSRCRPALKLRGIVAITIKRRFPIFMGM